MTRVCARRGFRDRTMQQRGSFARRADAAPEITDKVYFDVQQGEDKLGRIVLGLYGNEVLSRICYTP